MGKRTPIRTGELVAYFQAHNWCLNALIAVVEII
jgi:hypothetical protein